MRSNASVLSRVILNNHSLRSWLCKWSWLGKCLRNMQTRNGAATVSKRIIVKISTGRDARRAATAGMMAALVTLLAACRQDMHDQPRYSGLQASGFFADGRSARPQVEGTVARGQLRLDEHLYTGKRGGIPAPEFPFTVTRALLDRGRERFDIYCSPCHGVAGDGEGVVVSRGFKHPPTLHSERVRALAAGHYYDVISNGFGAMYGYASRIPVRDRWAIVAYLRALQLSQGASLADLTPAARQALDRTAP